MVVFLVKAKLTVDEILEVNVFALTSQLEIKESIITIFNLFSKYK